MRLAEFNVTNWTMVGTAGTLLTSGTVFVGDVSSTTNVSISTTPRLYTIASISNTIPKATLSPSGTVCGTAGIPVSFTAFTPLTLNYTLYYSINDVDQIPVVVYALPYTLPTPTIGNYKLKRFFYNGSTVEGRVDPTVVTAYANPNVSSTGTDQTHCGLTGTTLAGNNPAPYSGLWTIETGTGGTLLTPTANNSIFTGAAGQSYLLKWTNSNGGCHSSATVTIAFPSLPAIPAAFTSSPSPVCQGTTANVYTVPSTAGTTYNWSYSGTGATIPGAGTNSKSIDYNGTATSGCKCHLGREYYHH